MTTSSLHKITAPIVLLFVAFLAAVAFVGPVEAGSATGTKSAGESCTKSSECQADLRCKLLETSNVDDFYTYSADGELILKPGVVAPEAICVPAFANEGDDCNQYDCNRRGSSNLVCSASSSAIAFSGGYDYGECAKKGSAGTTITSWREYCFSIHPNDTNAREECIDQEGSTCFAESDCADGLICNTAETNIGGLFGQGRSGACTLPQQVGGPCEEKNDCAAGFDCNTDTKQCFKPADGGDGGGADGGKPGDGSALDPDVAPDSVDFGLNFFRGQNVGLRTDSPQAFITGVVRTVLGILAAVLVVLLVAGGIIYMTSAGNAQRVEQAKDIITYAIIGIVVVSAAFIIAELVIRALAA